MRRRARVGALAAMLGAAALSCTELGTDPSSAVSLAFDRLPSPAIVLGDTLRDSLGVATPLAAVAFNADNDTIAGAPIEYIVSDSTLRVDANGFVIADSTVTDSAPATPPRVFARIGGLSLSLPLVVTPAPESAAAAAASIDTVRYLTTPVSGDVGVRVTYGAARPVRGWVVSFALAFRGAALRDTTIAYPIGDQGRMSSLDTTGTDGLAARRIRIRVVGLPDAQPDSIIVTSRVRHRGRDVAGSPIRQVVRFRP